MLTINTNVNNLILQRNLSGANFGIQTAMERLTTGYRINSAADDAAGLVISKALEVQSRGLGVANQNAQMATNVLSVADGALGKMGDLTMRIRDLALQAANGGYGDAERNALEAEARELTANLKQLVEGTKFNEFNIFKAEKKGIISAQEANAQGYTIISTAAELDNIRNNLDGKYILMNDIDLSGYSNWNAIGTSASGNRFAGTFDGNGFTISNLKMDKTISNQGLFGYTYYATIKNVALENVDIRSTGGSTGALVGYAGYSTISNCSSSGTVTGGGQYAGGLIGQANGTTTNCYSTVNVKGDTGVGGLVGAAGSGTFSNNYATGNVTGIGGVGGFIGLTNGGTFSNNYATGNIYSANGAGTTSDFGGFIGIAQSGTTRLTNCYSTGQNNATIGYRGGFIGNAAGSVVSTSNSFIVQTAGLGAVGNGSVGSITQRDASYFTPALVQSTLSAGAGAGQWDFSGGVPILKWQVPKPPSNPLTFQIGTDGTNLSAVTVDTGFTLGGFSVSFANPDSARAALISCDALLKQINVKRGEIGASSNIISSIIDGNTVTNENIVASRSRVQDADIARESANAVRNQILQNASAALLSQSKNMVGDVVLMLLRGI